MPQSGPKHAFWLPSSDITRRQLVASSPPSPSTVNSQAWMSLTLRGPRSATTLQFKVHELQPPIFSPNNYQERSSRCTPLWEHLEPWHAPFSATNTVDAGLSGWLASSTPLAPS